MSFPHGGRFLQRPQHSPKKPSPLRQSISQSSTDPIIPPGLVQVSRQLVPLDDLRSNIGRTEMSLEALRHDSAAAAMRAEQHERWRLAQAPGNNLSLPSIRAVVGADQDHQVPPQGSGGQIAHPQFPVVTRAVQQHQTNPSQGSSDSISLPSNTALEPPHQPHRWEPSPSLSPLDTISDTSSPPRIAATEADPSRQPPTPESVNHISYPSTTKASKVDRHEHQPPLERPFEYGSLQPFDHTPHLPSALVHCCVCASMWWSRLECPLFRCSNCRVDHVVVFPAIVCWRCPKCFSSNPLDREFCGGLGRECTSTCAFPKDETVLEEKWVYAKSFMEPYLKPGTAIDWDKWPKVGEGHTDSKMCS